MTSSHHLKQTRQAMDHRKDRSRRMITRPQCGRAKVISNCSVQAAVLISLRACRSHRTAPSFGLYMIKQDRSGISRELGLVAARTNLHTAWSRSLSKGTASAHGQSKDEGSYEDAPLSVLVKGADWRERKSARSCPRSKAAACTHPFRNSSLELLS